MKGLYITTEGKKELEAKITELSSYNDEPEITELKIYQIILSSATIISTEEDVKLSKYVFTPEELKQLLEEYTNKIVENAQVIEDRSLSGMRVGSFSVYKKSITSQLPKFLKEIGYE